jgi:hypothetical protein
MKKVLLGSLLASGLLFAATNDDVTTTTTTRLSGDERIALATQSPRVHPARTHKHEKADRRMDQVVSDKHTVVAFIPYGK